MRSRRIPVEVTRVVPIYHVGLKRTVLLPDFRVLRRLHSLDSATQQSTLDESVIARIQAAFGALFTVFDLHVP
jgi:hypothetical protein